MGNCLVLEEKVITVVKPDGKILQYQAPIKVQHVLSDFSGHALSDSFSGSQHLQPDAKLHPGQSYYLKPVPSPCRKSKKKKVKFLNPEVDDEQQGSPPGVVRIKLIISKQELQELLLRKGGVSVQDMVSQIHQSKQSTNGIDKSDADDYNCRGWKPVLQSIAEVN